MQRCMRLCVVAIATVCTLAFSAGCQKSSHVSVRMYEYGEEQPARPTNEESDSEYKMQSPGEMVAPGEMVPPGRDVDDDED